MRITRYVLFFLFTGIVVLLEPNDGLTQPGGGKRGGGQPGTFPGGGQPGAFPGGGQPGGFPGGGMPGGGMPGGGGPRNFDPAQMADRMFNRMSNGKPTIVIAEMQPSPFDPQSQQRMTEFAQKKGITNGQLTKEQFTEYMQEQMTRIRAMMPGGGGPAPAPAPTIDENALRNEFRELDKNRDGVLSGDEIPADLKANLEKWDTNKDKQIQFDEYKEYYKSKTQPTQPASQPVVDPLQEEDKRSVVYDAKHLPKELTQFAPWFAQLDTDHDGQVALYEWKAAGRDINEFYTYDTNRDGLITVEEVLRYLKKQKPEAFAATATPEGSPSAGGGFGGGPRMPGGFGPPGGGMGGPTMPGGNGNWGGPGGGRGKGPGGGGRGPGGGDAAGPSGGGQKDVKRDRDMNGGGKGKIKQIQP